ncbi:2-oxoacid:acceptor oxidoreductase family protein [Desulfofundulus thermocisternus]|uniref:2-oxoacid:acceptor oxidoreductase family protein n=1 Tax=Desulfofundulus thermocisternus TaxID=42471 RepID=UPI00217DE773|nr:2-oxoacid:acceptor oxidoreductase family protein [Desulfofundulus thermocisternus]MCS5694713.1 2-oxoacid:acceptor oxidoreductase family protein [Desulfofundulus thermocisternus]
MNRWEIRISGVGGQGLGFGGTVFAEAVGIGSGYNVTLTHTYDFRARGGESTTDLVASDREIYFPTLAKIDYLLAMGGKVLEISKALLNKNSVIILNKDHIDPESLMDPVYKDMKIFAYPFTRLAKEEVGNEIVATMIGLGVLGRVSGLVSGELLREAITKRSPGGTMEKNLRALEVGLHLAL